jgi:hypothetical protein
MIFPLLWYCQTEKWPQVATSRSVFRWVVLRDLTHGKRELQFSHRELAEFKSSHRGTGSQEGPTLTVPTGRDDCTHATGTQATASGRATGPHRPSNSPPPHPSHPPPSLADIPSTMRSAPLKRFLLKSNPSTVLFKPRIHYPPPPSLCFLETPPTPFFEVIPVSDIFL